METEYYLSGYCRMLDGPRTVEVLQENGTLLEVGCCYGSCVHEASCPIACQIRQIS